MNTTEIQTITYTRKKRAINKFPITFKMDKDILNELEIMAEDQDIAKIKIVEAALKEYFSNHKRTF